MRVTELLESDDYEIHNHEKLDEILVKLCEMIIEGQQEDSEHFGMVAAGVLDPDNNLAASVNYPHEDGTRVHAERAAIEEYESHYGRPVPEGSIIITTLSPCNENGTEMAKGRYKESCTKLVNESTVHKVYCGYQDPSQGNDQHDERTFTLEETRNPAIRSLCEKFANTFLENDLNETAAWRRKEGKSKTGGLTGWFSNIETGKNHPTRETMIPITKHLGITYEDIVPKYRNLKTHHSVWNYDMAPRNGAHLTPKPVDLLENIINHTTDENDILLDCFAGSGSLGMACLNTNRKCILIEKEEKYCDYIQKTLNSYVKPNTITNPDDPAPPAKEVKKTTNKKQPKKLLIIEDD